MAGWNFAHVWETVAEELPDAPALIQGDRLVTWSEIDRRADGVARAMLDAGVEHQDKVANYLYNCPEYLEAVFATEKAGLVPVNTNYRYADDELVYLWDNADAVVIVFHGCFVETIERIRTRVPEVKLWMWVDDGSGPCPDWATPYEEAAKSATDRVMAPWGRSGDDIYMLYTGGTTGMPKGVMWRQHDLYNVFASMLGGGSDEADYDSLRQRFTIKGPVGLPSCPLMHGTGSFVSFQVMNQAGAISLLPSRHFEATELLDTIQRDRVNMLAIVGDAFAKPMLRALDEHPGKWDISSIFAITSSGVMWSEQTKKGLLKHHAAMMLMDAFSSSEALGMGQSVSSAGGTSETAKFKLGANARVITEDGRDVVPGSGESGLVAVGGYTPVGYYKDEEKSARTFKMIDGQRYSIPGDYATVDEDGTLHLLGRGSVCINTGGEKVFPEEVEEVIKEHESVADSVVVGVPDEKFGEVITAMVEPKPGGMIDAAVIVEYVKSRLSGYKAPKHVLEVDTIGRAVNGKVDYKRLRTEALERLGVPS